MLYNSHSYSICFIFICNNIVNVNNRKVETYYRIQKIPFFLHDFLQLTVVRFLRFAGSKATEYELMEFASLRIRRTLISAPILRINGIFLLHRHFFGNSHF